MKRHGGRRLRATGKWLRRAAVSGRGLQFKLPARGRGLELRLPVHCCEAAGVWPRQSCGCMGNKVKVMQWQATNPQGPGQLPLDDVGPDGGDNGITCVCNSSAQRITGPNGPLC